MSSGVNFSRNTVKRIKQSELQLNCTIHKINSSLAESLHEIDHTVRVIEQERTQSKGEFQPYYLRRRHSIEHSIEHSESDSVPSPSSSEQRERASSFGSNSVQMNRSPSISATASKESVASEDSVGKRDVSPHRRVSRKGKHQEDHPSSSLSQFYHFSRMKSRRNSLPMSFSLQNSHDFHAHGRDAPGEDGIHCRLRRVEHELAHRKPKSIRQLSATSMTSIDERKENEKQEMEKRQQAVAEYVNSVEECTYLRGKNKGMKTLSVEEIFH